MSAVCTVSFNIKIYITVDATLLKNGRFFNYQAIRKRRMIDLDDSYATNR